MANVLHQEQGLVPDRRTALSSESLLIHLLLGQCTA